MYAKALFLAAAISASASAQDPQVYHDPEVRFHSSFMEQFQAAPAIRAGDFVYISGVVGFLPAEMERNEETFRAAIRETFERVEQSLAPAGASWDDVIEMTTFHVDMREHQQVFSEVRLEYINDEVYPAWSAIGVDRLWADPLFVEIRVVAYLGGDNAD